MAVYTSAEWRFVIESKFDQTAKLTINGEPNQKVLLRDGRKYVCFSDFVHALGNGTIKFGGANTKERSCIFTGSAADISEPSNKTFEAYFSRKYNKMWLTLEVKLGSSSYQNYLKKEVQEWLPNPIAPDHLFLELDYICNFVRKAGFTVTVDYGQQTSVRGIKLITCEEAPSHPSGYTYEPGFQDDLDKVIGIRSADIGDGNITIGIGTGILKSDTARLAQYGLNANMTPAQIREIAISLDEAIELMMDAVVVRETSFNAFLNRHRIALTQYQYDALMGFTYNIKNGTTLWNETDSYNQTIVRYIRDGKGTYDPVEAEGIFMLYINGGLLVNRRQRDANVFNGKEYLFNNDTVKIWFKDSVILEWRRQHES